MRSVLLSVIRSIPLMIVGCAAPVMMSSFDTAAVAQVEGLAPNAAKGEIFFTPIPNQGLHISGEIEGLIPGHHYAVFIYENGSCSDENAPGIVFDPGKSGRHGVPGLSPGQHNAGDLPNVTADKNGIAGIEYTTDALGTGKSPFSVIGRSFVLHAGPSDYTTQPSGASGEIIACGVIRVADTRQAN